MQAADDVLTVVLVWYYLFHCLWHVLNVALLVGWYEQGFEKASDVVLTVVLVVFVLY